MASELAAAGPAFGKLPKFVAVFQRCIRTFKVHVITTGKIALRVPNQPIPRLNVKNPRFGGNTPRFRDLNCIHDQRLDGSVNHIGFFLPPEQ